MSKGKREGGERERVTEGKGKTEGEREEKRVNRLTPLHIMYLY